MLKGHSGSCHGTGEIETREVETGNQIEKIIATGSCGHSKTVSIKRKKG